jgi:hypothetical protein
MNLLISLLTLLSSNILLYKNEMKYFQDTNRSSRNKNNNNRKAGVKYLRK